MLVAVATTQQSSDIKPGLPVRGFNPAMPPVQEPTPPHGIKQELGSHLEDDLDVRGRVRSRSDEKDAEGYGNEEGADGYGDDHRANSSGSDGGPARKRRRSRKGLDKKFECPEKDCGKSYSRAEHLYRHQLNHNPKQLYRCEWGDCQRTFVRLDLCNRHRDRHTAKGSALSRKDSTLGQGQGSPVAEGQRPYVGAGSASPEVNRPPTGFRPSHHNHTSSRMPYPPQTAIPQNGMPSPYTPITNTPPAGYPNGGGHTNGAHNHHATAHGNGVKLEYMHHHDAGYHHPSPGQHASYQSPPGPQPQRPSAQTPAGPYGVLSPVSNQPGFHSHHNTPQSSTGMAYVSHQTFPAFTLPPSDFAPVTATVKQEFEQEPQQQQQQQPLQQHHAYPPQTSAEYPAHVENGYQPTGEDMMLLDQMSMPTTIPVFGPGDSVLNKSPHIGMPEDFMAYLFSQNQRGDGSASPMHAAMAGPVGYNNPGEYAPQQYGVPYYGVEPTQMGYFPSVAPQAIMSVTNLLDQNLPESIISEGKSEEIFEFIRERFHENGHAPMERREDRESIVEGDRNEESHMLSRIMMQAYIGSYWVHFSDQIPILHKPTFQPDKTPNLLLIAMMIIGAACLDKAHGPKATRAGAKLSNFLAWHLRWEMFQDAACRPPAKLWVFQTLILLELYEKMYSTRELHERAHIHHATTITLMRRGRALMGKSALDSPPNPTRPGPGDPAKRQQQQQQQNGSRQSSASGIAATPDEWWAQWISNEATRRAAFAAFVVDSVHATMFGHSTVMSSHEMRLPLPCDEKMWNATSSAEVGRTEANLMSAGNKPVSFLEGLKLTLSKQPVQTNSFGRTILMSGLLSVSWHMHQRDMQVNSLGGGVREALGGRDKWRSTLRQAFDSWKADFDKSLSLSDPYKYTDGTTRNETNDVVFESRIVLHHLAHMAMHVDIVDCQIFARAKRLLGRAIGPVDLGHTQRKMRNTWAPSAQARDATFYALRFLASVLCPDGAEPYSARDDVLLNRPWVLYFAALVVWGYGFALEGPCPEQPVPETEADKVRMTRAYLKRYAGVATPEELKGLQGGVNHNTAMLMMLKDRFAETRWELLQEGATLMQNCVGLNTGVLS